MQPGFCRSKRYAEDMSDFLVGEIVEIAEQDDGGVVLIEAIEGLLHALLSFSLFSYLFRVRRAGAVAGQFYPLQRHMALLCQLHALAPRTRLVESDTVEPRGKNRVAAKLVDRFKSGEKHLLSYLSGFV